MARQFFIVLLFLLTPLSAFAIEVPPGLTHVSVGKVLRGTFVHEFRMNAGKPMKTTGEFIVAPAYGLIWNVEKPFPTATVITPTEATQKLGGLSVKLPIRNLRSLYDMIGGALAGDWSRLESDFKIKSTINKDHWKMLLVPRETKRKLPYTEIAITGDAYVEKILMAKADGSYDSLDFSNEVLSSDPLTSAEAALFPAAAP